jgi:uncharacterized membrane protein HdeD (DUF308 family)
MADLNRLNRAIIPTPMGQNAWAYGAEGVLLILLGIVAILTPILASIAFAVVLGVILLVSGIIGGARSLFHPKAPGFGWALLSAAISIIAGLLLIILPLGGALSLTLVLAVYLLVEGIASIAYAWSHRDHLPHGWGWMVFNGVLDLIMAAIAVWVLTSLFAALWLLGLFIGVDLIFGGISLIRMGRAARIQSSR